MCTGSQILSGWHSLGDFNCRLRVKHAKPRSQHHRHRLLHLLSSQTQQHHWNRYAAMCYDAPWCAMMCYDVPCTLVPVSSWFRFSLASSSDHWNSRFAKKHWEIWRCSNAQEVLFMFLSDLLILAEVFLENWCNHNIQELEAKISKKETHHTTSRAILSHIGPCDATGIYMCLRCSSTTAPVLYNGAHVVLGSNMLQRFNCHKQEIAEILHGNCCKQDTSQYFRNLGQKIARSLRLENFSCCPKGTNLPRNKGPEQK